jgi:ATP-dependent protease Clp ATPase subunit
VPDPNELHCTSCGKSQHEVRRIVAFAPSNFLCDERIDLFHKIVHSEPLIDPGEEAGG